MEFIETGLKGAFKIRQKKIEDHRGYFARAWCREEFIQHGLNPNMLQLNTAFSFLRGTVRGMHYQEKPHEEAKLIRCTRGAIYDVIVDLRPDSPTCGQWHGEELTSNNAAKTVSSRSREVEFKLLAQPEDPEEVKPTKSKKSK